MDFYDLQFKPHGGGMGGIQAKPKFDNGYEASVIKTDFSYGGQEDLYEIAIIKDGSICYDTYITDDVLGYLTIDEVSEVLQAIENLPMEEKDETKNM